MSLQDILNRHVKSVKKFENGGDLDDALYDELYEYYTSNGEMPYGTAKARDGDPLEWISDKLEQVLA